MDEKEIETMKKIARDLGILQVLCVRYLERHRIKYFKTHKDLDSILLGDNYYRTFEEAIKILLKWKSKINNFEIQNKMVYIQEEIKKMDMTKLRIGIYSDFTELEKIINLELKKGKVSMLVEMFNINEVSEKINTDISLIKEACEKELLLNTKRSKSGWIVHLPECKQFFSRK